MLTSIIFSMALTTSAFAEPNIQNSTLLELNSKLDTFLVGEKRGTIRIGEKRGTIRIGEKRGTIRIGEKRGTIRI